MFDDRDTQIESGGSVTLVFSDQVLFDYVEYFNHISDLLVKYPRYESGREARSDILLSSLFVSVFSYLELMTGQVCDDLAAILHQKVRLKDINERSKFEGTRKYLYLLADAKFPSDAIFENLVVFRNVRNAVVHGNGVIKIKDKEKEFIGRMPGIECDGDGFLCMKPKFIEVFIEFCRCYVEELKNVAYEIAHGSKGNV